MLVYPLVVSHLSSEMPFAPKYCSSAAIAALDSKSLGSVGDEVTVKSRMCPAVTTPVDAPSATLSTSGRTAKSSASAVLGFTRNSE